MDWLQNSNIIYLMLAGGLAMGVLALASPGTGVVELTAVFILGLAGWLIAYTGIPLNLWSLGILLIGAALFVMAVRRPRQIALLIMAILALVFGSAYLFAGPTWWAPGVNLWLAAIVSALLGSFFWMAARKAIEAEAARPTHDLTGLIGAIGAVRSPVSNEGAVFVDGELWSARSARPNLAEPIPTDTPVRVVGREGLLLIVEPVEAAAAPPTDPSPATPQPDVPTPDRTI